MRAYLDPDYGAPDPQAPEPKVSRLHRTRSWAQSFRGVAVAVSGNAVFADTHPLLKQAMIDAATSMAEDLERQAKELEDEADR